MDAYGILKQLQKKMKGLGLTEKIKVDREDLVLDLFQELHIKIQFRRESAIDNGGLLRQAYEDAFFAPAKRDVGLKMF